MANQQLAIESKEDIVVSIDNIQYGVKAWEMPDDWFTADTQANEPQLVKLSAGPTAMVATMQRMDLSTYTVTASFWGSRPTRP